MGPLKGIRVLDLSRLLPGPLTTEYLARLGATVIKVESPVTKTKDTLGAIPNSSGDYVRNIPPFVNVCNKTNDSVNRHGILFEVLNCGKLGLGLDYRSAKGAEILRKILKSVDVIVEGSRPGALEKIGFGYEDVKSINPKIVYCSITGYGSTGPFKDKAGHDINFMATSGSLGVSGKEDMVPPLVGFQAADVTGSLNAVVGILAALLERTTTGMGQFVDISMTESALALSLPSLSMGLIQNTKELASKRGEGILDGGLANYSIYETSDKKYLSVGALEPSFWLSICEITGRQDLATNPSKEAVAELFLSKTLDEWMKTLGPANVCVEPVLSVKEVFQHPQHMERGVTIPTRNSFEPLQLVLGPKLESNKPQRLGPAPRIGQDNKQLLQEIGLTMDDIEALSQENVISQVEECGKITQLKSMPVEVETGKPVYWCSCGLSDNQPFCDGKHKGTTFKPVKVVPEQTGKMFFCGCRRSFKGHLCDGSHKHVVVEDKK